MNCAVGLSAFQFFFFGPRKTCPKQSVVTFCVNVFYFEKRSQLKSELIVPVRTTRDVFHGLRALCLSGGLLERIAAWQCLTERELPRSSFHLGPWSVFFNFVTWFAVAQSAIAFPGTLSFSAQNDFGVSPLFSRFSNVFQND